MLFDPIHINLENYTKYHDHIFGIHEINVKFKQFIKI